MIAPRPGRSSTQALLVGEHAAAQGAGPGIELFAERHEANSLAPARVDTDGRREGCGTGARGVLSVWHAARRQASAWDCGELRQLLQPLIPVRPALRE